MSTTVNSTHRKRLARALAAQQGIGYLTALDQVTKAATSGLLPARLDDAGMAAALRILSTPTTEVGAPRLSTHVTVQQTLEALADRKKAADPRDQQIFDLSAVYEAWTGKQGLIYISSPGGGKDRYVFGSGSGGGHVCLGREEALTHITGLVNNATPPPLPELCEDAEPIHDDTSHDDTSADRFHLEKPYLALLRQVWQGRVSREVTRATHRSAVTHFAIDNKRVGDKQEIELHWLLSNDYITHPPLAVGEEWAVVKTTEFGDEVLAFHGADTDRFTDGMPSDKRRGPRVFTIKRSDIARCPISSMAAEHYNDDGTCKCVNPGKDSGNDLNPAIDRLMGGPTTTKVYDSHNRRVNATCDVCNRRLKTGEPWWMVHSPNRNWENNAGVSCSNHSPETLPTHTVGDAVPTIGVHAARPSTLLAEADGVGHCAVCMQSVKRAPGGRGPTWIHAETGAVAAAGVDPQQPLSEDPPTITAKGGHGGDRDDVKVCARCGARVRRDGQKWATVDEPLGECLVGLGREHRVLD